METLQQGEGIEMKNVIHRLISLFPLAEEIRELEDRSIKIVNIKNREKKKE